MKRDLLDLASSLTRRGVSFVMATVVRREGGSATHVGDMALVTGDGAFHGWIGSDELRAVVEREAARVLAEHRPCLICLSSSPDRGVRPGVVSLPSPERDGTVDIYLAPVITSPRLVLIGRSPVLRTLAQLARTIGYRVDRVDRDAASRDAGVADRVFAHVDDPRLVEDDGAAVMAVVVPRGERAPDNSDDGNDATTIAGALAISPSYLGVIASRRRFALLRDALSSRGVAAGAVDRIAHPAGLALGAHEPGEVAVAILAQIVARRNGVVAVNEASVTLSESSEVTSTMDIVIEGTDKQADKPLADKAATASCFPAPARDRASRATLALRVRGSSSSLETRARASSTSPPPSDGTPLPVAIPAGLPAGVPGGADPTRTVKRAVDPVCQVYVVIADAHHAACWDHRTWHFCSATCKAKFLANPLRYAGFAPMR